MRVLVTGSSGFVGPHLVAELLAGGHEVSCLDRSAPAPDSPEEVRSYTADIENSHAVLEIMRDSRCQAVVHLAGWSHVGESWKHPAEVMRVNACATISLFEAASSAMGAAGRFLFVSSADVYGTVPPGKLPITEEHPLLPESPYALSKLAAEQALRLLHRTSPLCLLVARPFNHIGPGQAPSFVCPAFARQVAEIAAGDRDYVHHGNLTARRDFLDVRDVVAAYRLILEEGNHGDIFNISSGKSRSIEEILLTFFDIAGIEPRMKLDPRKLRPVDTPDLLGDSQRLTERTGWQRRYHLRESLEDIYREAQGAVRQRI